MPHIVDCIMSYSTFTVCTAVLLSYCSVRLLGGRLYRQAFTNQQDVPVAADEVFLVESDLTTFFDEPKDQAEERKNTKLGVFRALNELVQAITGSLAIYGLWSRRAEFVLPFAMFLMWKTLVRTVNVMQFAGGLLSGYLKWDSAEVENQVESDADKKMVMQRVRDLPLYTKCLCLGILLICCALVVCFYAGVAYLVYACYATLEHEARHIRVE